MHEQGWVELGGHNWTSSWKMETAVRVGLPSVAIDNPGNRERGGGSDQRSPAVRWPKKWPKSDKNAVGVSEVASDDSGSKKQRCWSQNVGRRVGNMSGVSVNSDWPLTSRKMVRRWENAVGKWRQYQQQLWPWRGLRGV